MAMVKLTPRSATSRAALRCRGIVSLLIALTCVAAHASSAPETTPSYIKEEKTLVCPSAVAIAFFASSASPKRWSTEFESLAAKSRCKRLRNDKAFAVLRIGPFKYGNQTYRMAMIMPLGVVINMDGYSGPYYLLASEIDKIPTTRQMQENEAAFQYIGQ